MSDSEPSKVFLFDSTDPATHEAYRRARATFKYFWREVSWENRRIIRGLSIASVKAPFSDGDERDPESDDPSVEHMWISEVDFDGRIVSGVLLNAPNWLKTVSEGDAVRVPLEEISDWMYVIGDEVFGGHSVNLLRSRMDRAARREHDEAWGLNFGDPNKVRLVPEPKPAGGFLKSWFGGKQTSQDELAAAEHPMSENAGPAIATQLQDDPEPSQLTDERGWTQLHHFALAGSAACVKVLLDHGADPNAKTDDGRTPVQLAQALGWDKVVAILRAGGAK